MFTSF